MPHAFQQKLLAQGTPYQDEIQKISAIKDALAPGYSLKCQPVYAKDWYWNANFSLNLKKFSVMLSNKSFLR
jgi:hypothetical protein